MKRNSIFSAMMMSLTLTALAVTGCKENSTTDPAIEASASSDAADVAANSVGGSTNEMTDVAALAQVATATVQTDTVIISGEQSRTYDIGTKEWTVVINRNAVSPRANGTWTRTYKYAYTNKNGEKQKFFVTGTDTAATVDLAVTGATGTFTTPRLSHTLTSLSGSLRGTVDVTKQTVTINTNALYSRSAVDKVTTYNGERSSNHTLTLTYNNVVVPYGQIAASTYGTYRYCKPTSGSISGTYDAQITFVRGSRYGEGTVNRSFTINFNGTTTATVEVAGTTPYTTTFSLESGEAK